jgi:hypothetical protein
MTSKTSEQAPRPSVPIGLRKEQLDWLVDSADITLIAKDRIQNLCEMVEALCHDGRKLEQRYVRYLMQLIKEDLEMIRDQAGALHSSLLECRPMEALEELSSPGIPPALRLSTCHSAVGELGHGEDILVEIRG